MSFKGTFKRIPCNRLAKSLRLSFELKCTNLLFGETVDVGLFPSDGSQPWYFRNLEFKAGQTLVFNYDTVDWDWYQGDYAAILGKNDKIIDKWELRLKEYGPGECPDCHGTHKCRVCHGQGFVYPGGKVYKFQKCNTCGGTGICKTCDVPRRKPKFGGPPTGLGNGY